MFSRKQARRDTPEGRVPSERGRSALARLTTRVVPVVAAGGLAGLSLVLPAVTAAAPAVAAAQPIPAIGHPVLTKGLTAPIPRRSA